MNTNSSNHRPSAALAVSVAALVVALGGTGYAASQLPKDSVGKKQLQDDSVTTAKVVDGSLGKKDFKKGELPAGPQGPKGPAGPTDGYFAQKSVNVPVPTTYVEVAGLDLPAGSYLVTGSTTLVNISTTENITRCAIRKASVAPTTAHSAVVGKDPGSVDGEGVITVAIDGTAVLAAATTRVSLVCRTEPGTGAPAASVAAEGAQISALKVATLHQ